MGELLDDRKYLTYRITRSRRPPAAFDGTCLSGMARCRRIPSSIAVGQAGVVTASRHLRFWKAGVAHYHYLEVQAPR
jgi:hypothetical protein